MMRTVIFISAVTCFVGLYFLIFFRVAPETVPDTAESGALYSVEYHAARPVGFVPIGDDQPISRGMAAKMLVLAKKTAGQIHAMEHIHPFRDVSQYHWHAPYINAAFSLGIMRGSDGLFLPDEPLTIGQAQTLLLLLDPDNAPTFANIPQPDRPITYALWVELYKQLLEGLSSGRSIYYAFGITAMDIIVLATAKNSPLPDGHLVSDHGSFRHVGLMMDGYIDQQIRVLVKDREIVALDALVDDRPTLKNAFVVDAGTSGITVFSGGVERFFYWADERQITVTEHPNQERSRQNTVTELPNANSIVDIVISDGFANLLPTKTENVSGILLRASDRFIELKGLGLFHLDPDFKVYDISDGVVRRRNLSDMIVGTEAVQFYLREDETIGAGVITHEEFPEQIRVVIGTSNFAGLIHSSVSITATGNFWITTGGHTSGRGTTPTGGHTSGRGTTSADTDVLMELAPGQRFTVSDIENTDLLGHPRLFFHTEPGETLQLTGLGRNWPQNASPRYRGIIEIAKEDGGYSVINVLCIEEYLYAVVPSEMPSSYGLDASKVQAVTARSFAVHQVMANRFHAMGGNIDDSVMSQVYNNIPENDISIQAVDETRGLVLWYGDQIVQANFFSTSAGMTANSGEVWLSGTNFPGHTPTFLRARPQIPATANRLQGLAQNFPQDLSQGLAHGLSNEARAAAFLRNTNIDAYDSHSPWFRWQLEMTPEEISASVNAQLDEPIGNLTGMTVMRRGEGGNIMELLLTGDAGEVSIVTELNVRRMLRPARAADGSRDIAIRRHDGSTLLNLNMLPSAFFTFNFTDDMVVFHGGGHGHGVGMSQNGVKGMVTREYSFEEILAHFYPGTVLSEF